MQSHRDKEGNRQCKDTGKIMKIYLIDCNSYIYRFYYAVKGLSNSKELPTNAIYGFTGMLLKMLKERDNIIIVAVFDSPQPTKRHEIYDKYKANRPIMPDDLIVQIPVIKDIIDALGIHRIEMPGYEADDILGSLAKKYANEGHEVSILSGDKDLLQLVDDRVRIYDYMKDALIDKKKVIETYGVEPEMIPDIMALTGDSIDNIPGVKGIGEKKAKELISMAGSVEALLTNPDIINNNRIRRLISENADVIRLSKRLATLDLSYDVDIKDIKTISPDWDRIRSIFAECEFKGYLESIRHNNDDTSRCEYFIVTDESVLKRFLYNTN